MKWKFEKELEKRIVIDGGRDEGEWDKFKKYVCPHDAEIILILIPQYMNYVESLPSPPTKIPLRLYAGLLKDQLHLQFYKWEDCDVMEWEVSLNINGEIIILKFKRFA